MEVLCVGLPRSGTESLPKALLRLGYDYTFHVLPPFQFAFPAKFPNLFHRRRNQINQNDVVADIYIDQGWDMLFEDPHRMQA
jgi:hypothetical protein